MPKEVKNRENRVGMLPTGVRALVQDGHQVHVQQNAGIGSGILDAAYVDAGAIIVPTAEEAWATDMVVKVKEPQASEFPLMKSGQTLFTYLHLAAEAKLTEELLARGVTSIAYETVQDPDRNLPLLRPMSEVAGRMSVQVGAFYLQSSWDMDSTGRGVLLGGVPGVLPGNVVILGGGVAGANAALVALGMGARVKILDVNPRRLEYLDHVLSGRVCTLMSNIDNIHESAKEADLLIGAVLVPGARAPKLVTKETIAAMPQGSVVVDIAVDQGGCIETCRPTSHENPTYTVDGVVHYCVTNMPGAVARTSTFALTNVTLGFTQMLAKLGPEKAAQASGPLSLGFHTYRGELVHQPTADAHQMKFTPLKF